ncbi:MAG: cytochrome P450 [Halofilum sp. (in: g-proteobacteria)]|nr:cytochrome P450 [Halofilum sp. (in: g-proteobacteria)]
MLDDWAAENRQAIRDGDRARLGELAQAFDTQVRAQIEARRGCAPDADLTASLMHESVDGRPLRDDEIVSILRNWTVGEVGTIAAAVGILAYHLAADCGLQQHLRSAPGRLPAAIDEILRVDGPLPANRRVTTCPVEIGGRSLDQGERLSLSWIAANRDPAVFEQPHEIRLDRDPADNLLYGAGIHVCPGAPLARLELRVVLEELLDATRAIEPASSGRAIRAEWPAAGFDHLPLQVSGR